jgi:hypothetical protein
LSTTEPYRAAGPSLRGSDEWGGGNVTSGIYLPRWESTRTALGDSGADDGQSGTNPQLAISARCTDRGEKAEEVLLPQGRPCEYWGRGLQGRGRGFDMGSITVPDRALQRQEKPSVTLVFCKLRPSFSLSRNFLYFRR